MHIYSKLCISSCQMEISLRSEIMSFFLSNFLTKPIIKTTMTTKHSYCWIVLICWYSSYFLFWWTTPNFYLPPVAIFSVQVICLRKENYNSHSMLTIPVISAFLHVDFFTYKIKRLFCIPESEYFFFQSLVLGQSL